MAILSNRPARGAVALAALLSLLLLAGCGGLGGAEATPLPTRTPLPTFTPTPEGGAPAPAATEAAPVAAAATQPAEAVLPPAAEAAQPPVTTTQTTTDTDEVVINTPAPAQTPTAAPSPTSAAAQVTANDIINIRSGPGTAYTIIGGAQAGQSFPVSGKNGAGDWWQINYQGQTGWVFGQLVTASGTEGVAVAQNIPPVPTAPPATATPLPQPTQPPVAQAQPTAAPDQPTAAPAQPTSAPAQDAGNYPYVLGGSVNCQPNPGITYFKGFTRDANNNLINAVCIHIDFYGPRTTKCSGCDGVGDGNWGFAPFGNNPAPSGTPIEIFVVECPANLPQSGQSEGFGNLTPQSPKWTMVVGESVQCEGITFYKK